MTDQEKTALKQALQQMCRQLLEQRISHAQQAMLAAQESANSEEKSSAGDKYETGRAMSQIDRDRNAKQLVEAKNELAQLQRLDVGVLREQAGAGAVVDCTDTLYFIAAAVGVVELNGKKVVVLSPKSPLAQSLAGKKPNDEVLFNGKKMLIRQVF